MRRFIALVLPSAALGLTACGGGGAEVAIALTRSSGLAAEADKTAAMQGGRADGLYLHVLQTRMHIKAAGADEDPSDPASPVEEADDTVDAEDEEVAFDEGWVIVSEETRDVDLLSIAGTAEEIASGDVPPGTVKELRLLLDPREQATLVVDGRETSLEVPSGSSSGLKLKIKPAAVLSSEARNVFSVELKGTFETGSGKMKLHPTAKVMVTLERASASGSDR